MRVAIVSYYTPPDPAVASHRVLRMSRALLREGHEVHWVTLDRQQLLREDASLGSLVPDGVVRHELGGPTLASRPAARNLGERVLRTIYHHLPSWLALPDKHVEWALRLRRRLPELGRVHGFDAVVMTCGPHGQLLSLPRLRRALPRAKILVDYRDLLSGNPWTQAARLRVRARLRARERRLLAHADGLFVNSTQARASFVASFGELELPVAVMRNAADYELAEEAVAGAAAQPPAADVVLGYFGTIFPRRMLTPVFAAMERLPAAQLDRVQVDVYCDAGDSRLLLERDLEQVRPEVAARVCRRDYLPYREALSAMRAASALLLVNGRDPADDVFVPGKLFDYVMACRPTLFVGGHGDAREIVARTSGSAWCFGHDDLDGVAAAIARLLDGADQLERVADYDSEVTFSPLLRELRDE